MHTGFFSRTFQGGLHLRARFIGVSVRNAEIGQIHADGTEQCFFGGGHRILIHPARDQVQLPRLNRIIRADALSEPCGSRLPGDGQLFPLDTAALVLCVGNADVGKRGCRRGQGSVFFPSVHLRRHIGAAEAFQGHMGFGSVHAEFSFF